MNLTIRPTTVCATCGTQLHFEPLDEAYFDTDDSRTCKASPVFDGTTLVEWTFIDHVPQLIMEYK